MRVPPVPLGVERPTWSVMIPSYDAGDFLARAIESVLRQAPGPEEMQIEVVDDCSPEDPGALVDAIGAGRVALYRRPVNGGNVANFNTCLERARGTIVHLLHADDEVADGFYRTLERPLLEEEGVGAAFCRFVAISEDGRPLKHARPERETPGVIEGWLRTIARGQRLQPPAIAVRRDVYERVGGFDVRVDRYAEDWEMWVRIAAATKVWYDPAPLALYRVHSGSISGRQLRTGANVRILRAAIELNRAHFEPEEGDVVAREALRTTAVTALRRGGRLLRRGDSEAMWAQLREALRSDRSPGVLARATGLLALRAFWPVLRPAWPALRAVRARARGLRAES